MKLLKVGKAEVKEEGGKRKERLSLAPETPPEIKHAYYLAIAQACKEFLDIPPEKLRQAISERLAWAESLYEEVDKTQWQQDYTRYFWNSTASGASGWIGLDDEMRVIGDRKIACKWTLKFGKKTIILPPSNPVFVGWVGDDRPEKVFADGDYIEHLYYWLRARVIDDSVSFLGDLDRLIANHPLAHVGKFYFTQMINGTWELRWNHRHRALPIAEDWFLLELAQKLERVARLELQPEQLWAWVDLTESSFKCSGKLDGRKVSLAYYEENGTWGWRLSYCRRVQRVRRYWVGAIAKAIRAQDEVAIRSFIEGNS